MRKGFILIINGVLLLMIIFIILFKYYKKEILINCDYNSKPDELFKIISTHFPDNKDNPISLLFVFNDLPTKSVVAVIEKLYYKLKDDINISTIFTKKFKYESKLKFRYKFLTRFKILCRRDQNKTYKDFFLISKNNAIKYCDTHFDLRNIFFSVMKYKNPKMNYQDFVVSPGDLKENIINKLKVNTLTLLNLYSTELEKISHINNYTRMYFFHANCSACQLRSFVSSIKLEQTINDKETSLIIFSVLADQYEIRDLLNDIPLRSDVYLDVNDEFGLLSIITDEKNNPFIIPTKSTKESQK